MVSESVGTIDLYVRLIAGSIERSFPSYVEVKFSMISQQKVYYYDKKNEIIIIPAP